MDAEEKIVAIKNLFEMWHNTGENEYGHEMDCCDVCSRIEDILRRQ